MNLEHSVDDGPVYLSRYSDKAAGWTTEESWCDSRRAGDGQPGQAMTADTEQARSVVRESAWRRRCGCRTVGRYLAGVGPSRGRPVQKNSSAE
jgi:hypothetical protein